MVSASKGSDADSDTTLPGDEIQFDHTPYSPNLVFHILRNERRRGVLYYLQQVSTPVQMRALTRQLAAWEYDVDVDDVSGDQRETIHISLYQTHLPTLNEHGIIDWDKDRGEITEGDDIGVFYQFLTEDTENGYPVQQAEIDGAGLRVRVLERLTPPVDSEITWSRYYLTAAAVGAGLTLLSVPEQSPVDLPLTVVVIVLVAMIAMISFAHTFYESDAESIARVERLILGESFR